VILLWDALGLAARALQGHRFRALLTMLSISIGAFAIVLMSSLAHSAFATIKRGIEQVGGSRLILIVPKSPERAAAKAQAYRLGLTPRDRDSLFRSLPHVREHALYATFRQQTLTNETGKSSRADLVAGDAGFLRSMRLEVATGRPFETREHEDHGRVCVIGHAVARELWAAGAVGRTLTVADLRCRVIGVLAPNDRFGFSIGFDWEKLVVMPAETAADRFSDMPKRSAIVLATDSPATNDVVKRIINARLVELHHGIDDFFLIDFASVLRKFYAAFVIMEVIASCLAGVALLIGGIGIMNMMLVSVSERTREIGIQKALGAGPAHLRAQFLSEAALLSLAGGVVGTALGVGLANLGSLLVTRLVSSWVGMTSWVAVCAALLCALSIGVAFGWLPARRAALLAPVEAMRR
jgi:putative ABC transport system permease protein